MELPQTTTRLAMSRDTFIAAYHYLTQHVLWFYGHSPERRAFTSKEEGPALTFRPKPGARHIEQVLWTCGSCGGRVVGEFDPAKNEAVFLGTASFTHC